MGHAHGLARAELQLQNTEHDLALLDHAGVLANVDAGGAVTVDGVPAAKGI